MEYEVCDNNTTGIQRMESLLHVEGVSKSFRNNDGSINTVLKDFNLDIKDIHGKPQIVALLGQSGSGKTTALRIIAGLEPADAGSVTLSNGERNEGHAMHSVKAGQVGVVFQKYPLFDHLTTLNNLVQPAVLNGMNRDEANELAHTYLTAFELPVDAYPVQLSGGMRQRVAILQQLMITNRHFIVMDEPFSGLDVKNVQLVTDLITKVARLHTLNTFIVVTHDVTNALMIADTVYVLGRENGKGAARIMKEYYLIEEGLAYHPNLEDIPRFQEIRKEIKYEVIPKL
jgi:ABC-type nitrate/sulfonate/bicarbonate transport system ATPase subunit